MNPQELTPGELAQRAGVAVSALHFYEREGLITSRRTLFDDGTRQGRQQMMLNGPA